jgi:hypothetical protein
VSAQSTKDTQIPGDVIFDRVVFVPPIPKAYDGFFFPYYGSSHRPVWAQREGWVRRGDEVCGFVTTGVFRSLSFPIKSPASGFMLPPHEDGYGQGSS